MFEKQKNPYPALIRILEVSCLAKQQRNKVRMLQNLSFLYYTKEI